MSLWKARRSPTGGLFSIRQVATEQVLNDRILGIRAGPRAVLTVPLACEPADEDSRPRGLLRSVPLCLELFRKERCSVVLHPSVLALASGVGDWSSR